MHVVTATPETDFAAFRRTGDPAALARVFDAAAPRLLLLAAHWTRDPAEAEDLVQVTFVQAVRDGSQWREGQPLLRWLSGILAHRALDRRRLAAAHAHVPLDEALVALAAAPTPTPLEAAIDGELLDRIGQALDRLEAPYRDVLTLRIVHGLQPTAIAHALARPPATVRKQLERGLQQLRGLLPAAFAGALAAMLLPQRGLAAVRAQVLAAAGAPLPAAALTLGGMLLVKKIAIVVLAVAAIALLCLQPWTWPTGVAITPAVAPVPAPALAAAPSADPQPAPPPEADAARTLATVAAAVAAIEVLAVRDDDGTALAGVAIELAAQNGADAQLDRRTVATDAAGRAAFDGLAAGSYAVAAALRDGTEPRAIELHAGERRAVELRVPIGGIARGTVVAASGEPVAGATVFLRSTLGQATRNLPHAIAVTAADGSFAVAVGVGTVALQAAHPDHASSPLVTFVGRHPPPLVLRLLAGPARLEGHVRIDGEPVADALLELRPARSPGQLEGSTSITAGASSFARSDRDGAFALASLCAGTPTLRVRAHGAQPQELPVALCAGATESVTIDLLRAPVVQGRVRAVGGGPLAGASVRCGEAETRTDATGAFQLDCLHAGPQRITAGGLRDHTAAQRRVDLVPGPTTIDFELEPLPLLRGRVVDVAGRGLPGLVVTAYRKDQGPSTYLPVTDAKGRFDDEHDRNDATDQDGAFAVPVMPDVEYTLHLQQERQWLVAAGGDTFGTFTAPRSDIVLTVRPEDLATCYVAGRALGADGRPLAGAWLQIADGKRIGTVGRNTPGTDRVGPDGSFRVGPVPARRYTLKIHPLDTATPQFDSPPFELKPGATLELGDVTAAGSATLAVTLRRRGGGTFEGALLQCEDAHGQQRIFTFDKNGRLEQAVVPGRYDVVVYGDDFPSCHRKVELVAGQPLRLELELPAGVAFRLALVLPDGEQSGEVTILGADGAPEFEIGCERADTGGMQWSPVLTEGAHTATLQCANGHRYASSFVVGAAGGDRAAAQRLEWTRVP